MAEKKAVRSDWLSVFLIAGIIVVVLVALVLLSKREKTPANVQQTIETKAKPVHGQISTPKVMRAEDLKKDESLKALMQERKEKAGVTTGLDMIIKADESIKIGDSTVPMKEILDKISLENNQIIEKDIEHNKSGYEDDRYGIYIVQPGDNIWNIHFKFLSAYLENKGVSISPIADEPNRQGFSSGVGKILKFSESMVYIYNVKERSLDVNLNLIQPLSKLVVYNMKQVFGLLDQIDYERVNRIEFDGETIWIPSDQ